jgi:peptidoglycan/xylan/chitin deacetylase (PgdA/CDA1 family)
MATFSQRAANKVRRTLTSIALRRPFEFKARKACISFTFDDFPVSASRVGAALLSDHGVAGTFYLSTGLMRQESPSGQIAGPEDVYRLLSDGHEIGCHTFGHADGAVVRPVDFMESIDANQRALAELVPELRLSNFAYPLDGPSLAVKAAVGSRFRTLRGSGQTFNRGTIDRALLKAYFLDARSVNDMQRIERVVADNAEARGWLLFATHDISENPSSFGCSTRFFTDLVRLAVGSGAFVGSVTQVCDSVDMPRD